MENTSLKLFDTTLRDGLQARGFKTTLKDQITIAEGLLRVGFDTIEAGCPVTEPQEALRVREVLAMAQDTRTKIAAFTICKPESLDASLQSLEGSGKQGVISLLLSVGDVQIETRFGSASRAVDEYARFTEEVAKSGHGIHAYLENATRANPDVLTDLTERIRGHVSTISVPDTAGSVRRPVWYGERIRLIKNHAGKADVSAHTHGDLSLANANALTAVEYGVDSVEGTLMGIGERIGNLAWEEFLYCLLTQDEHDTEGYGRTVNANIAELGNAIRILIERTGIEVYRKKPFLGWDAYGTKAGLHQDGILKNPKTYLANDPSFLGLPGPKDVVVFGSGSGKASVQDALRSQGFPVPATSTHYRSIVQECTALAATTEEGELPLDAVAAIALDTLGDGGKYALTHMEYESKGDTERICLKLRDTEENSEFAITEEGEGGLIHLACSGLSKVTGIHLSVEDDGWQSRNIGSGADAPEFIRARMKNGKSHHVGLGIDRDSNRAGVLAVIRCFNKAIADQAGAISADRS